MLAALLCTRGAAIKVKGAKPDWITRRVNIRRKREEREVRDTTDIGFIMNNVGDLLDD